MSDLINQRLKYQEFEIFDYEGKTLTPRMVIYTPLRVIYLTQVHRKKWRVVIKEDHTLPSMTTMTRKEIKKLLKNDDIQVVLVSSFRNSTDVTMGHDLFRVPTARTPLYHPVDYHIFRVDMMA